MVRETRHLWVGNLPDNVREDRIREHFKRYGRVQSVKLLSRSAKEETGENTTACTVAFMDIKSASKAHTAEHKIDDKTLTTEYYEPAAIPSTASPQNTNSAYSTSPGSTRFTNSHGTPDEHGNFNERFYERNSSRVVVADSEYIRRQNYHDSRNRNRDRSYRNGPYNSSVSERHRSLNSSWSYDSSRSYNSETGYGTPTETNDKRSSDSQSSTTNSSKKKTKSPSESRSVSPSGSNTSRSPSRSRSQSSSSSSSSTTSQGTSSTSSRKSRRIAGSSNSSHQPIVHSDDKRPLAICVKNLPLRSSDTSLKDGLFHEYKKHGKVTWVKIVGVGSDRHAIVCFKKPEDVDKAIEVSYDKLFFGCKIEVAPYQGYDVDDNELRPYEAEIDEFHPKATRTLFIGNLEKDFTASDLRKHFDQFGEIIEIDIKKQGAVTSYAFCQYSDIISVVKAIRAMDGEHLGNNRIKLGFGKSMPTSCVWVDGVVSSVTEKYLTMQFDSFGPISQVIIDRDKGQGLVFYEQVANAQVAVTKMRGVTLRGRKVQVDFASRECQESFYEHLEKQGHVTERQTTFEEKREPTSVPSTPRYARYETPSRPRSTSYNATRSSASGTQCNTPSAVHSPGTPGSVTPRGTSSRSRSRVNDYYDQVSVNSVDYVDRRYRSYDEFSQSSAASHEDVFEHDHRESPIRVEHNDHALPNTFPPPEMRILQKERFHLLEQLDDYTSSGDELANPKKRIKIELDNTIGSDVIIEANRDHRKVMEVRRTSDSSLKHYSRRPSADSKHPYLPHAVCKRRKTGGSDSSSRVQHHELSGSESIESSRPGTPLCDERPENLPSEPRRVPRDREGPLSLPLPRFAAQVMGKGSVSVAGIKGQKDNILSSPPPAVTSPRISNPSTPGVPHVPPPASPPPRPPSPSSNSSDSDITAPSPSLDERIKSLDEKYEKWSGSRSVSAAGSEALAKLDASASERFRFSYKLLDLDLKELQPSEIVKSVLAKPSVFDEDLKRLENVNEKYDINLFTKVSTIATTTTTTLPSSPIVKAAANPITTSTTQSTKPPLTPLSLSPRSTGTGVPTAKGLQYPFPTHPPVQPLTPTTPPSAPPRSSHGESRLKPCGSATSASDARTSATNNKIVSSRTGGNNLPPTKNSELTNNNKNSSNTSDTNLTDTNSKQTKSVRDKSSEKVIHRRDSTNSCELPKSEIKSRRNSENSGHKSDSNDKQSDNSCDTSAYEDRRKSEEKKRLEHERLELERTEQERIDKERLEKERKEKFDRECLERLEKERIERLERERLEKERLEKERMEKERLERERLERIEQQHKRELEEKERKEREEKERREREERDRREREEQERLDRERKDRKEKEDKERREREEREKREKEEKERKHEEERKHKEDNHERRSKDEPHSRHHNDNKHHKDSNNIENLRNDKSSTKDRTKETHELHRKDSHESHNKSHEKHHHNNEKSKHHSHHGDSREVEKRKDSAKENRENNLHDKIVNEIKEHHKIIESRHISIDLERNKIDPSRRKDKSTSLPVSINAKRRMSLQDTLDVPDDSKRIKLNHDHRKLSERRDSKDSIRSEDKIKTKHKNNIAKIIEDKIRNEKLNIVKEVTTEEKRKEDKHKHRPKSDKQKSKEKVKEKEALIVKTPSIIIEKEFLAKLDLQATEDVEKARQRKESKDKLEDIKKSDERKKDKRASSERRSREDINSPPTKKEESKLIKKERIRKMTHSSDAATDSDEPKKQSKSIFDIVDDEPAYISMYDKVKARSCKNMQKLEEEKRQEQIKAKFNQLKQSRAKREEKKRSTSWDDSDSDHDRRSSKLDTIKTRKGSKVLLSSDDEEIDTHIKHEKKKDIYSDSDQPNNESSDEEKSNLKLANRGNFDDDFKRMQDKIKSEIFSDSNELDQRFIDLEEKVHRKMKDDDGKHIRKERKKKSHHLSADEIKTQIFGDSPLPDIKTEDSFDNGQLFGEGSSGEEKHDIKKELRKKHKKKNKRQKYSVTSEEETKLELTVELIKDENIDRMKVCDKKKPHSKKDKKKDKNKDEHKEKSKKSKRAKSESRREGKMENIFGSFSEESDNEKEQDQTFLNQYIEDKPQIYTDSDSISHIEKELQRTEERERKEKRKERKRLEKEKRLREEENDNSMDFADLGKQLEDNIKDDANDIMENIKIQVDETNEEPLHLTEADESQEIREAERKEKEKKKKRKKSKEEKHKHHHHHHDKSKRSKSPEIKKDHEFVPSELEKPLLQQSVSLPNLLDLPSPPLSSNKPEVTSKKRDIFIPEFGSEVDETAVKSISEEFDAPKTKLETTTDNKEEEIKQDKPEISDDKPRVVISQEETEDAVAALLGESFGDSSFPDCYTDVRESNIISNDHVNPTEETEAIQEDLEEMRQAVQNLNSGELEIKPDTPQSEHELQIDTDTEEVEDSALRFDQSPRTPDMVDLSQPPKTPDIPSYFSEEPPTKTIVIKATITSPPSLTPIKPSAPLTPIKLSAPLTPIKLSAPLTPIKPSAPLTPIKPSAPLAPIKPSALLDTKKVDIIDNQKTQSTSEALPSSTSYSIPIKISEQVKKELPESVTVKPYTLTLHMQQQQQKISFNRLPITPIVMSKPFHQTTISLPQPKVAQSIDESSPSSKEPPPPPITQSRVIFQGLPSQVPQFLLNSQNTQARMIVQNMQLPRTIIRPSGTFTALPSKTYMASEPPKLVPTSHPLTILPEASSTTAASEAPKLVSLSSSTIFQSSIIQNPTVKPTLVITTGPLAQSIKDENRSENISPSLPVIEEPVRLPVLKEETAQETQPEASSHSPQTSKLQIVLPVQQTSSEVPTTQLVQTKSEEVTTPPRALTPPKIQKELSPVSQTYRSETPPPLEPIQARSPEPKLAIEQIADELNLSLTKAVDADIKTDSSDVILPDLLSENEELAAIRNTVKLEDDKGETESIESDISKERSSADLMNKDDGLDSKEDSDYWSAKEVNIDSVIKKVDALCSADELSDRSSEIGKDDWFDVKTEIPHEIKMDEPISDFNDSPEQVNARGGRRISTRARGRKMRGGILTRRGKATKEPEANVMETAVATKRVGRPGRSKIDSISKSEEGSSDVYEFRDEADENKDRPRLILTIKSPVLPNNVSVQPPIVKELPPKESAVSPKAESKEDFVSPTNTRKSRRLQERGGDASKTTIDDTIEDVIKNNNVMVTRSAAAAQQTNPTRRSTRQTSIKSTPESSPRKSPRSMRKKDRRTSDTTDDSSEEKSVKNVDITSEPLELCKPADVPSFEESKEAADAKIKSLKEKPHEGLKAAVLRRVKGEMNIQEPMTLIDPVTGVLIPMRECEEGRYIPVGLANTLGNHPHLSSKILVSSSSQIPISEGASIQTSAELPLQTSASVIQQKAAQSFKAHMLSSQANRVIITPVQSQPEPSQKVGTLAVTPPVTAQSGIIIKSSVPINQHLNINVPTSNIPPAHLSPRPYLPVNVSKSSVHNIPPVIKIAQPPPQIITHIGQTKQPHSKAVLGKPHLSVPVSSNIINSQLAHMKQQVAMAQVQVIKPHSLHSQQQVLTAAVASPPLKQVHQQPIIGASSARLTQISANVPNASAKSSMEPPPKVDVSMAGCAMVPHPISSPQGAQGQARLSMQNSLPLPPYEANLGDTMTHFPSSSVKLRPSHDLIAAHYIHPHMYQQYLRQSYHLPRTQLVVNSLEKSGDGQEGEEAPVELRRPGSVGLALTGRTPVVPHSLQSPHDRTTDSPQVGQVYIHNSRLPHYHTNRYFDQAEPPPAHRPLTSHTSLAALGNDRSIGHIATLGTPDRPLSSHLTPDRPHSALAASHITSSGVTHLPPDRPLSGHGFQLGTGLGAAGNLMGAVARHISETPANQRGLQAATPPHASQVPPQAESLVMLLKQFPCMWQGLLALKNDQAAVQMYFVSGNDEVAKCSLPKNIDGSTPPLRIFQRMRLEPPQVEGVARKMQMENEHCMLLALPCGHDHMDVLKQSTNLSNGFITYLQQKQAAGIVNVAAPGTTQPPAYVVHIFPSCDFVNENLRRFAPNLLERVSDIAHLLIVITTV